MGLRLNVFLPVFVLICCTISGSLCFRFTSQPSNPAVVVVDETDGSKKLELQWHYNTEAKQIHQVRIEVSSGNMEKPITKSFPGENRDIYNQNDFLVNVNTPRTAYADGHLKLTVKNILEQGNDGNNQKIEPLKNDFYGYIATFEFTDKNQEQTKVDLRAYEVAKITTRPVNGTYGDVSMAPLTCVAKGKPVPSVTWTKIGSSSFYHNGSSLSLTNAKWDSGIYQCLAFNGYGKNDTSTALVHYSGCPINSCPQKEVGIELTRETWRSDYPTQHEELRKQMEFELTNAYTVKNIDMNQVRVTGFRKGSVVAKILLQTNGSAVNLEPLDDLIRDGSFAGKTVKTSLVTATKAPNTGSTTPTSATTNTPDAGKRTNDDAGGLSPTALYSIIAVAALLFIIAIIVLVVCLLKRKKPSDTKKGARYQPDSGAAKPYKPPPPRTSERQEYDMYDNANANNDRYPNGERNYPPPQYEPTAYAEVKPPLRGEPDKEDVEWDQSVNDGMWI